MHGPQPCSYAEAVAALTAGERLVFARVADPSGVGLRWILVAAISTAEQARWRTALGLGPWCYVYGWRLGIAPLATVVVEEVADAPGPA